MQPRFQLNGERINDDQGLEHEAEVMGATALASVPQVHGETKVKSRGTEKGNSLSEDEDAQPAESVQLRALSGMIPTESFGQTDNNGGTRGSEENRTEHGSPYNFAAVTPRHLTPSSGNRCDRA